MPVNSKTPILLFKAQGQGNPEGHTCWIISKAPYQIQPGDFLEYDLFIDKIAFQLQTGLDLQFKSAKRMSDMGLVDQFGTVANAWFPVLDAGDSWFHRQIDLSGIAGETIVNCQIAYMGSLPEIYLACFAGIRIRRGERVVHPIFENDPPTCFELSRKKAFSGEEIHCIRWEEYRAYKLKFIEPAKLSPEIQTAQQLQKIYLDKSSEWQPLLTQAENALDLKAYLESNDEKFAQSLTKIQKILSPIFAHAKNFTLHLVGHAHIDMNWLWVWNETLAVIRRDFETMTKLMAEFPAFHFSQSQAVTYKAIEKAYPDIFRQIQKYVERKQWEITASMWVEGDENMTSGEALVRQFLLGKRYIMKKFGVEPVVCWQPDLFGHVWTMPQIIKKCGSQYYFFMRCPKDGITAFWWQGPDGSKVLAYHSPNYNGTINNSIANFPLQLYQQEKISHYLHSYGVGDHGGGPTRRDIETILDLQQNPSMPTIKFDSVAGYFESLLASGAELPIVNDELQFIFPGCYTTHADIKLRNRRCENLFPVLEFFSLMAWPYELAYPEFILDQGWERTCFNHFHDILPGSGIHAAYQETLPITDGMIAAGEAALERSLRTIAEQINTNLYPDKKPLIVFNPTNWDRTDVVQIRINLNAAEYIELLDAQQQLIPCQLINRTSTESTLLFIAERVPSMGYKTYWWAKCRAAADFSTDLKSTSDYEFENQYYLLKIDPNSGNITSLTEKDNSREYITPGQKGNVFQLYYEKPGEMSAWVIGEIERIVKLTYPTRIDLLEKGPVRILLQVTYQHGNSEFIQQIALYSKMRRIDFPCYIDWYEQGTRQESSPMLKVCFPINMNPAEVTATFDIPFGHIVRPANGEEVPAQKWIDISNHQFGVSLLNDCKYGHNVNSNVMHLTLLRCSFEPDQEPDQGAQRFTYALLPHADSWRECTTDREGLALNQPLRAVQVQPRAGHLPPEYSFISVSMPNVIISAMKKSEESDAIIFRFYESHGQATEVEFNFAFTLKSVVETDMLERELENGQISHLQNSFITNLTPFEIKTFKIVREPFKWPKRHGFLPV